MEANFAALIGRHFGTLPERVRLPGIPKEYDEVDTVELVTPNQAMAWIVATWERHKDRNFYPTTLEKIQRFAKLMAEGNWTFEPGATIDITSGSITGGRHRLHAILLSHTEQRMTIKRRTLRSGDSEPIPPTALGPTRKVSAPS